MEFGIDLNVSQSQGLIITKRIEQSLNILKMDSDDLNNLVEDELLNNPILEISEQYYKKSNNYNQFENMDNYINSIPDKDSNENDLYKFLVMQLNTNKSNLSKQQLSIAKNIIYSIDKKGYLPYDSKELANIFQKPVTEIAKIINLIKSFEPRGIASRNLCECLLLQTDNKEVRHLITNYLEEIASNNISKISSETNMTRETIINYIKIIKNMNPIPSLGFSTNQLNCYIYPDIIVVKKEDKFLIEMVRRKSSYITINDKYLNWINKGDTKDKELFQKATILIKAIRQREQTINKIVEKIIDKQIHFFEKGKLYLVPMNMSEIADEIMIHESTVSRAINSKYLQCKWGTFELKYFFSNKSQRNLSNSDNLMNPHELIKEIINDENKSKPLSDEKISKLMKEKGIAISRRTVTKYREQMKIPSSKGRIKW
ncbi:MAG: RNA polymerase factor sigma-54 [Vallitalea sp.]|jgi:RNA polymerase sigma-54 factor|nr:RNA polymerase factor sigma-54 [Vallitalea sp.]